MMVEHEQTVLIKVKFTLSQILLKPQMKFLNGLLRIFRLQTREEIEV